MMTVLVLASEWDRTADGVVSGLTERGVAVMRVDLSWFPQRLTLDAEFCGGSWHGHLRTEHHEVDIATVRSVWVRTPSSFQMPDGMSAVEREFAKREAKLGVDGVLLALPDVLWVNRPDLAARAVYRPAQWATAAQCGLSLVPRKGLPNRDAPVTPPAVLVREADL